MGISVSALLLQLSFHLRAARRLLESFNQKQVRDLPRPRTRRHVLFRWWSVALVAHFPARPADAAGNPMEIQNSLGRCLGGRGTRSSRALLLSLREAPRSSQHGGVAESGGLFFLRHHFSGRPSLAGGPR